MPPLPSPERRSSQPASPCLEAERWGSFNALRINTENPQEGKSSGTTRREPEPKEKEKNGWFPTQARVLSECWFLFRGGGGGLGPQIFFFPGALHRKTFFDQFCQEHNYLLTKIPPKRDFWTLLQPLKHIFQALHNEFFFLLGVRGVQDHPLPSPPLHPDQCHGLGDRFLFVPSTQHQTATC